MKRILFLALFACSFATVHCSDVKKTEKADEKTTEKAGEQSKSDAGASEKDVNKDTPTKTSSLQGKLIINEVAAKGDPDDWVELYNAGSEEIDLTKVYITDDLAAQSNKTALQGSIKPGEYKVVALNDTFPGFKLGSDEEVGIFDEDGALIDSVDWEDGDSPAGESYGRIPDKTGGFKTLKTPTPGKPNVDGSAPSETIQEESTTPDAGDEPTPDATPTENEPTEKMNPDQPPAPSGLVINEVAAAGDPDDWFELYNGTNKEIDLSTYSVADSLTDATARVKFPAGTKIKAGEYIQFTLTKTWPDFKLGKDEELGLFDANGNTVDSVDWNDGDSPADKTFGRFPNGTGNFTTLSVPTPGKANIGLVINEVAAAGDPDDWFELYNATGKEIDLSTYSVADSLTDATARVKFPAGTKIKPGEYMQFSLTTTWPNFKLGKDEELGLFDANGNTVDSVDWNDGDSPATKSYGRSPDITGAFKTIDTPSPAKANP